MPAKVVQLRNAVASALGAALSITIETRAVPYLDAKELESAKYIAIVGNDDLTKQTTTLAERELAVDIALQQRHPKHTDRSGAEIDLVWVDSCIEKLDELKAEFLPGGTMVETLPISGASFRRYEHSPLFNPEMLYEQRIFTGVVRLIYNHCPDS